MTFRNERVSSRKQSPPGWERRPRRISVEDLCGSRTRMWSSSLAHYEPGEVGIALKIHVHLAVLLAQSGPVRLVICPNNHVSGLRASGAQFVQTHPETRLRVGTPIFCILRLILPLTRVRIYHQRWRVSWLGRSRC